MPNPVAQPVTDDELLLHPLFAELGPAELATMRRGMRSRQLAAHERLFEMGARAEHFYLVRSGQVQLFRVAPNGAEKVIEILGPGQAFAEAVMFMDLRSYPVNAAAVTPAEVLAFEMTPFLAILRESPATCLRVLGSLSMRLHRKVGEIESLSVQNATLRLANFLLAETRSAGRDAVALAVPKRVLASRLSLQPETLSRVLGALAERGVVVSDGATLRVLDAAALERIALGD
jgi:CRP-like cAMP-binding protein